MGCAFLPPWLGLAGYTKGWSAGDACGPAERVWVGGCGCALRIWGAGMASLRRKASTAEHMLQYGSAYVGTFGVRHVQSFQ